MYFSLQGRVTRLICFQKIAAESLSSQSEVVLYIESSIGRSNLTSHFRLADTADADQLGINVFACGVAAICV